MTSFTPALAIPSGAPSGAGVLLPGSTSFQTTCEISICLFLERGEVHSLKVGRQPEHQGGVFAAHERPRQGREISGPLRSKLFARARLDGARQVHRSTAPVGNALFSG